jgi:hypothetical protein
MGLFRKKAEVIDLRDSAVAERAGPRFEFGFPTRCPACGGRGYLDHIDPFKRMQFEHCPSCATKWERSEDQVLSLNG